MFDLSAHKSILSSPIAALDASEQRNLPRLKENCSMSCRLLAPVASVSASVIVGTETARKDALLFRFFSSLF
jgi:hypothetical protein